VVFKAGLLNDQLDDNSGDDCAFETSKLSLPLTEDETLQSMFEADTQREAEQTENPTLIESECPSDEIPPPSNVMLVEPELGALEKLLERT